MPVLIRSRTSVRFKPPSGAYQSRERSPYRYLCQAWLRHQAFADVTSAVRAAGSAARTRSPNVQAQNSGNRYAGWALVVVTRETGAPLRQSTIFDGFARTADTASDLVGEHPRAASGLRRPGR